MELLKAISDRRAYRALSPDPLPDDAVRRKILVDNPVRLYGF